MEEEKKSWSWLGFLFAPYYYSGYGKLNKGLVLAVISGLLPLLGIGVAIYGGLRAKKELPIGQVDFKWLNVGIALVILIIVSIISQFIINSIEG